MNPLFRLSPALYATLNGLVYAGEPVPVYEHVPTPEPLRYVRLGAPGIGAAGGRPGCQQWPCTATVEVVTRFATGSVSSTPADEIAEYVLSLLQGQPLLMPPNWQAMPGQLDGADDEGAPSDGQVLIVRRRLKMRWAVFYHGPPAQG